MYGRKEFAMKVLITGGLGFVGTQISNRLIEKGHQVTVVDRAPQPAAYSPQGIKYVPADTTVKGAWQEEVAAQDAVINLAGASIFTRWNDKTKKLIHDSRILTTLNVVEAMEKNKEISEDEHKRTLGQLQKLTDAHIAEIDQAGRDKEKELLEA